MQSLSSLVKSRIRKALGEVSEDVADKVIELIEKAIKMFLKIHNEYYAPEYDYPKLSGPARVVTLRPAQALRALAVLKHCSSPAESIPEVGFNDYIPVFRIYVAKGVKKLETGEVDIEYYMKLWNFAEALGITTGLGEVIEERSETKLESVDEAVIAELYLRWYEYADTLGLEKTDENLAFLVIAADMVKVLALSFKVQAS